MNSLLGLFLSVIAFSALEVTSITVSECQNQLTHLAHGKPIKHLGSGIEVPAKFITELSKETPDYTKASEYVTFGALLHITLADNINKICKINPYENGIGECMEQVFNESVDGYTYRMFDSLYMYSDLSLVYRVDAFVSYSRPVCTVNYLIEEGIGLETLIDDNIKGYFEYQLPSKYNKFIYKNISKLTKTESVQKFCELEKTFLKDFLNYPKWYKYDLKDCAERLRQGIMATKGCY